MCWGIIQRGGSPTAFDRRCWGLRFGVAAVELIAEGKFGQMVCWKNSSVGNVSIAEAIGALKTVDPKGELVRTARAIGIGFGN